MIPICFFSVHDKTVKPPVMLTRATVCLRAQERSSPDDEETQL